MVGQTSKESGLPTRRRSQPLMLPTTAKKELSNRDKLMRAESIAKCYGLIGWNGMKNVGDDAMTAVIVNYISKTEPGATFALLADQTHLSGYSPESGKVHGYRGYSLVHRIPYARSILRRPLFLERFVKESDVILLGGGSIFHHSRTSYWHEAVARMKRDQQPNSLIGAIGISLGPFRNSDDIRACESALRPLDFVVVRDEKSYSTLKTFDIPARTAKAMDLAILLPQLIGYDFTKKSSYKHRILGVALCKEKTSDRLLHGLSQSINRIMVKHSDMRIRLFVFCGNTRVGDRDVTAKLQYAIEDVSRVEVMDYSDRPFEFYKAISECWAVVAMRLHAAILAYSVNTPFIMLSYAEKCESFAKEVGLSPDYLFDADPEVLSSLEDCLSGLCTGQTSYEAWTLPIGDAREHSLHNFSFLFNGQ
jgi:polysaccharide pyruvyl transferase WcaK-like protein